MIAHDNLTSAQKTQATINRDVHLICTELCHLLGLDITRTAIEIIAELVVKKLKIYGADLEVFAKHAKRNTIMSEDIRLLVRRNPSLKNHLNKVCPSTSNFPKRRKTSAPQTSAEAEKENKENVLEVNIVSDEEFDSHN